VETIEHRICISDYNRIHQAKAGKGYGSVGSDLQVSGAHRTEHRFRFGLLGPKLGREARLALVSPRLRSVPGDSALIPVTCTPRASLACARGDSRAGTFDIDVFAMQAHPRIVW
jgi:hypothetical protein